MPIGNELYLNHTIGVLMTIVLHSKPVYAKFKQFSGYGLKKEDFDKRVENVNHEFVRRSFVSSKIFFNRKKFLLENQYIKPLQSKEKRSKFYGITPLGIAYLCSNISELDNTTALRLIEILKFYYEKGKPAIERSYLTKLENVWIKLSEVIGEKDLLEKLRGIVKGIKVVKETDSKIRIDLMYENYYGFIIPYTSWNIIKDEYRLLLSSKLETIEPFYHTSHFIGKFIVKALCYDVVSHLIEDKKSMDVKNPTLKEKKEIKEIEKKLENIPVDIMGVSKEFSSELGNLSRNMGEVISDIEYKIQQCEDDYYPKFAQLYKLEGIGPVGIRRLSDSGIMNVFDLAKQSSLEVAKIIGIEKWENNEGVKNANNLIKQAKIEVKSAKTNKPIYKCEDDNPKTVTKVLPFGVWKLCDRHARKYIFSNS